MGNENSHKISHFKAKRKQTSTENDLNNMHPNHLLIHKIHKSKNKLVEKNQEQEQNQNQYQNAQFLTSRVNDNIYEEKVSHVSSCKNIKNFPIKEQKQKFEYFNKKVMHSSNHFLFPNKSIHPTNSSNSYDRSRVQTHTIIKTYNSSSPKTYLKIKSPKKIINLNNLNMFTYKPKINSQVHFYPCIKTNSNSPIKAKIKPKIQSKIKLNCLSNEIMDDLNENIPSLKQKILSGKKIEIEIDKNSSSNKNIIFHVHHGSKNPQKNQKSSSIFKARFLKDEAKGKVKAFYSRKSDLFTTLRKESKNKTKEKIIKKGTLKIDTKINIPYNPTPSLLYKWEGKDGPLNHQLVKEYYKSLCILP